MRRNEEQAIRVGDRGLLRNRSRTRVDLREGFDLLVAADRPEIHEAAEQFRSLGAQTTMVEVDLASTEGVNTLWAAAAGRHVDVSSRTPASAD